MLRYVEESRDEAADRHIDVPGMLTVTGGLVCISLAFDRGEAWGWGSAATLGTLAAWHIAARAVHRSSRRACARRSSISRCFATAPSMRWSLAGSLSNVVFCLVAVFSALYLQQRARAVAVPVGPRVPGVVGGRGRGELLVGTAGRALSRRPPDGPWPADQRRRHRGCSRRVQSLWLYVPLFLVCRHRPGPRLGTGERGDPGGGAAIAGRARRRASRSPRW